MEKHIRTDVLVIGQGLAGQRAAAEAARRGAKVVVLGRPACASAEIMGMNAVMGPPDSVDDYYRDLLESGRGLSRRELAYTLALRSAEAAHDLMELGLEFDRLADGSLKLARTLGCGKPRMLSIRSYTGANALRAYRQQAAAKGAAYHSGTVALELVTEDGKVRGAVGFDGETGAVKLYEAGAVVLAAGGSSGARSFTTYPRALTGDGYAMAYRAGALLTDMEFVQFEPCCFVEPEPIRGKLAVTTLLFEGGVLRGEDGREFLPGGYDMQKSALALYIARQMARTGSRGVYYDVTALPAEHVNGDYDIFFRPARSCGLDVTRQPVLVAPAVHTCIGGVLIDRHAASTLPGLYAAGEVTGGVHGANRIGGCAGSETLVFGKIAGASAAEYAAGHPGDGRLELPARFREASCPATDPQAPERLDSLRQRAGRQIRDGLGIIKDGASLTALCAALERAQAELAGISAGDRQTLCAAIRLQNILQTAQMQARSSLLREESRGVFFRADFPREDNAWEKNILIRRGRDGMDVYAGG